MNMLRRKKSSMGNTGKSGAPGRAMGRLAKSFVLSLSFAGLLLGATNANALACTSAATGNWSAAATWAAPCNIAGGPVAADTVTIAAAHTVTVTANAAATSITIAAPSVAAHGININPGIALSVSGAITMAAPAANNRTSTLAVGTGTLNAGSIAISGGTGGTRVSQLTVGATGIVNVTGAVTMGGTAAQSRFIATGASTITVGGAFSPGAFTPGASTLTVSGNFTPTAMVANTGTVILTGGAAQSMRALTTYNNVIISKTVGTIATLAGNTTMTGALTVTSGTLNKNTRTLGVAGNLAVNGVITGTTGNITLSGAAATINGTGSITTTTGVLSITTAKTILATANLTIASPITLSANVTVTNNGIINKTTTTALNGANATTSIWVNAANSTLNYAGTNAPMVTGVLTASANPNTVNYTGAAQAVKATTYHHLGFGGSLAKTAAAGLTVNGDLTLSGTATFTAGAFTHNFAGNWIVNTTAAAPLSVATTSVINFNTPAIPAPTSMGGTTTATIAFADVNINNTSGVTFNDNASFQTGTTPTLTVAAGATLTPAAAVIISGTTGTLTGTGTVQVTRTAAVANVASQYTIATKTLTNLTIDFAGVGVAQTVDVLTYGSATGGGLKVSNASGVNLTANTTVAGTLTLAGGVVNAGAFTLSSSGDCTTKVVRSGGHVAGLLQLAFPIGAPSCTFHVGDTTAYRPINASFASVTAAGSLAGSVSQAAGEHPNIATSGLDSTKDVNRYWTITNPVGGTIAYTTYSATFNFINPSDFDAGATPANFEIERWDGAAWNVTTLGAATSTSTSASGLPFVAVSGSNSFALGEKNPPPVVVSINCSISCAATSAATVSWTVTFSKSVTGVDATDFALAATGVSGAFITAVTGSGTTWTVTANTGIGSGTLGLNLVDDDTIVDTGGRKLGGTGLGNGNFTGQVYTISATPALAEYRMDEAIWNGTANEVADSSGSGNHAQAFNSATTDNTTQAIPGSPGTCRNGVFDNGTTITQGYVQTPLPDLNTDFTITAWIRTTNNTIAGQRILIDDQNNTGGYGISLGDGAAGILRFYSRGITPIVFDSTYTIASNTWYFVAAVADITNRKRTIYVFNAAGALLNSTAEAAAFTGTWGTDGGPVSIGAETNASAELPATYHFRGNLDEVRVYQKVLSQTALTAIATQSHACPIYIPDHLEIQSSGSGLTCAASTLTIKACTDAAIPCAIPYTLGVSGTLSASGPPPTVNWDGTTGGAAGAGFVIPNGGSSVTKNVQVATAGTVTFGVAAATPAPTNATACNFGTNPGNNNCVFTANTAGFIFSDSATGNTAYTIPALTSGIAQNTDNLLWLRAVQASTANAAVCTPAIIGQTVTVDMGYTCNNPAVCQAGNLGVINGTAIAPAGTPVSFAFDANGSAKITSVRYDDVGEITLTANKTVTPFGGATAVTLNGSSNPFVVKPAGFVLSGIKCSIIDTANCGAGALAMATPGDNPAAADAAGATFIRAGHPFTATVTAKNALGNTTKNYGQESTAESVKLTPALVGGLGLTNNPLIGGTFGVFSNGVATGTAFTWNEAGIITLTPSVGDGNYLGAGDASGTASGNIGRFYAAQFALTGGVIANRTGLAGCAAPAGCGTFTYMGEQMSAVFTLTAQAVDGTTTLQNYNWSAIPANQFAKLNPMAAVTAGTGGPLDMGAVDSAATRTPFLPCGVAPAHPCLTPAQATAGAFASGVANVTVPLTIYRGNAAAGPYATLDIGVAPVDSDGAALTYNLDTVNVVAGTPNHTLVGQTQARYGRLRLSNAHGSELLPLTINVAAQFWNGTTYVTNVLDNNSTFAAADVILNNYTKNLASGETSVVTPPASVVFTGGVASYQLARPSGGDGQYDGSVNMTVNALSAYLPSNTARATFGVYRGSNEFIYLREAY